MSTKSYKVYKNLPFCYKIVKHKYFDVNVLKSIDVDTLDNVNLVPFDGINVSFDGNVLSVSGVLPNEQEFPEQKFYWGDKNALYLDRNNLYIGIVESVSYAEGKSLANLQYNYDTDDIKFTKDERVEGYAWLYWGNDFPGGMMLSNRCNFSVYGAPVFDNFSVSFPNTSDYLLADKTLSQDEFFDNNYEYEFISKVTPKTLSNYRAILRCDEANKAIETYGNAWCLYAGGKYTGGEVVSGTTYWVKVVQAYSIDTKTYKTTLYTLENNGYTLSSLPDDGWTSQVQVEQSVFEEGNHFTIGTSQNKYNWDGSIDLDNTVLKQKAGVDYQLFWKPLGE